MDIFQEMTELLRNFKYPNIETLSIEEIAEIFDFSNRTFLITWLLKNINKSYDVLEGNTKNPDEVIAEFLYNHGFCTEAEQKLYINKDLTAVIKILKRIFHCMKEVNLNSIPSDSNSTITQSSDLEGCVPLEIKTSAEILENNDLTGLNILNKLDSFDLNLFPEYGNIKTSNAETDQREQEPNDEKSENILFSIRYEELKENINKLKTVLPKMKSEAGQEKKMVDDEIKHDPELGPAIKLLNENLKIISQYISDVDTVENISITESEPVKNDSSLEDLFKMMKLINQNNIEIENLPFMME